MSSVKKLTFAGLLVAIDVLFTRFLAFYLPGDIVRVSLQFLAHGLCGWILGPLWSLGSAVAGDLLGMAVNSAGRAYLPGYTLSAALSGLLYGLILYKRKPGIIPAAAAVGCVTLFVSLGLNSLWSMVYFEKAWFGVVTLQASARVILFPVYSGILFAVQRGLAKPLGAIRHD